MSRRRLGGRTACRAPETTLEEAERQSLAYIKRVEAEHAVCVSVLEKVAA